MWHDVLAGVIKVSNSFLYCELMYLALRSLWHNRFDISHILLCCCILYR